MQTQKRQILGTGGTRTIQPAPGDPISRGRDLRRRFPSVQVRLGGTVNRRPEIPQTTNLGQTLNSDLDQNQGTVEQPGIRVKQERFDRTDPSDSDFEADQNELRNDQFEDAGTESNRVPLDRDKRYNGERLPTPDPKQDNMFE